MKRFFWRNKDVEEVVENLPRPPKEEFHVLFEKDLYTYRDIVRKNGGILPTEASSSLRRIDDILRQLLPYMENGNMDLRFRVSLESLVQNALVNTVKAYVALPPHYRDEEAERKLLEQCFKLEEHVSQMADSIYRNSYSDFEVQSRVIEIITE